MTEPIELYKSDAITNIGEDQLGRKPFIEAVANFIKSQATKVNKGDKKELRNLGDPLTIGIYGKWGYGKTSVIRCLETEIKSQFFTAYYNPWMYNNEEDLVQHLFETIVTAIDSVEAEDKKNKKELVSRLKKYSLGFLKGLKAKAKFGIPLTDIGVSLGYDAKPLAEAIEKDIEIDKEETIYDVKNQIDEVLTSLTNPIVVFIDDIDRLSKSEIYILFKTVRLIADFKNIIYVLSFDDEMVAKSIKDKFAGGTDADGFNYLEKIIDIPIRLPSIEKVKLEKFLRRLVGVNIDRPYSYENTFDELIDILMDNLIDTPRDCIRIANSVRYINNSIGDIICLKDLIIIESLRIKSGDGLFQFIKSYYDVIVIGDPTHNTKKVHPVLFLDKVFNLNLGDIVKIRSTSFYKTWRDFFIRLLYVNLCEGFSYNYIDDSGAIKDSGKTYDNEKKLYEESDKISNPLNLITYFEFIKNLD